MKSILTRVIFIVAIICSPVVALLATEKELPVHATLNCTKEELMTFFPKAVVKAVLIKSKISEEQADSIAEDLSTKDAELDKIVKDKASKLDPNPLHDLNQRDVAIKIYRESLFQGFAKVLRAHGITDDEKIQALLDELQRSKSQLFVDCIRRENPEAKSSLPLKSSESN
jgi:hypothetical protein